MVDPFDDSEDEAKNSTGSLFVGLYLVVLAFFILLNSMASIQPGRSTMAIGSVKSKFGAKSSEVYTSREESPVQLSNTVHFSGVRSFISNMTGQIKDQTAQKFQLREVVQDDDGDNMRITMRDRELYRIGSDRFKLASVDYFERLSQQLNTVEQNTRFDIEFIIYVVDMAGPSDELDMAVARLANFAQVMEEFGVSKQSVFIGLKEDASREGFVQMRFKARDLLGDDVDPTGLIDRKVFNVVE